MSREDRLQQLLINPHIWKQGKVAAGRTKPLPSGFTSLDQLLGGGWPVGVLTELMLTNSGVGELRLLMPALEKLQVTSSGRQQLCWISPPYIPYAPALAQHGLDLAKLLIVSPESPADALWATEQALRSRACAAVFAWLGTINQQAVRRLQLAAESTACWGIIFRHVRYASQGTAAPLRIALSVAAGEQHALHLQLLRNRYGPLGSLTLAC